MTEMTAPGRSRDPGRAAERGTPARTVKKLLVASAKGGTGKTTTARNLAVVAVHDGLDVATVDFDRQATLSRWWTRRPDEAPAIRHYQAPIEQAAEISEISGHDLIVIDTPPGVEAYPAAVRALVRAADFILVPTQQNGEDLDSTIAWMRFLKEEGAIAAYLLNATNRRAKSFERAKRRLVQEGVLCPIDVPRYEDIPGTTEVGLGIIEVKGGKGGEDYLAVWAYVRRAIGI